MISAGGRCEQVWLRQGHPPFDVVHPAFHLPTTTLRTLQGAVRDGFGEAALACVTCPNHADILLMTVFRGGSCVHRDLGRDLVADGRSV